MRRVDENPDERNYYYLIIRAIHVRLSVSVGRFVYKFITERILRSSARTRCVRAVIKINTRGLMIYAIIGCRVWRRCK